MSGTIGLNRATFHIIVEMLAFFRSCTGPRYRSAVATVHTESVGVEKRDRLIAGIKHADPDGDEFLGTGNLRNWV